MAGFSFVFKGFQPVAFPLASLGSPRFPLKMWAKCGQNMGRKRGGKQGWLGGFSHGAASDRRWYVGWQGAHLRLFVALPEPARRALGRLPRVEQGPKSPTHGYADRGARRAVVAARPGREVPLFHSDGPCVFPMVLFRENGVIAAPTGWISISHRFMCVLCIYVSRSLCRYYV